MLRRSLLRYMNLALILVLRSISSAVKQRFPTLEHVVEAGFMTNQVRHFLIFPCMFLNPNKFFQFIRHEKPPGTSKKKHSVKIHIFWEGHKILRNLHHRFVLCSNSQIYDFAKFCGLLSIYELYQKLFWSFTVVLVISKISQILGLQPRFQKFFSINWIFFLTLGQDNFCNKIPFLLIFLKESLLFQSLNHQEGNLKVRLLLKSSY